MSKRFDLLDGKPCEETEFTLVSMDLLNPNVASTNISRACSTSMPDSINTNQFNGALNNQQLRFSVASPLNSETVVDSKPKMTVNNFCCNHPIDSHSRTLFNAQTNVQTWNMLYDVRRRALNRSKLKQTSQISALLSGFALVRLFLFFSPVFTKFGFPQVALVEMDIDMSTPTPLFLMIFFIVTTTLLVSVHMIALMISTCILPHIESTNAIEQHVASQADACTNKSTLAMDISRSHYLTAPSDNLNLYVSIAWYCSTVIGIFLFILELGAIVWVKFWNYPSPTGHPNDEFNDGKVIALISTFMLFPVFISLVYFAYHFYRKLVLIQYEMSQKVLDELHVMADQLERI